MGKIKPWKAKMPEVDAEGGILDPLTVEMDRNARGYGYEIGKGKDLTETVETSDDNPFLDPNWRDNLASND